VERLRTYPLSQIEGIHIQSGGLFMNCKHRRKRTRTRKRRRKRKRKRRRRNNLDCLRLKEYTFTLVDLVVYLRG
jgi:hypothetical protein